MARAALTPEAKEERLQFAVESWQAEKERVSGLLERTAKLRALRLAEADPVDKAKRVKPSKPRVRKANTVIR